MLSSNFNKGTSGLSMLSDNFSQGASSFNALSLASESLSIGAEQVSHVNMLGKTTNKYLKNTNENK